MNSSPNDIAQILVGNPNEDHLRMSRKKLCLKLVFISTCQKDSPIKLELAMWLRPKTDGIGKIFHLRRELVQCCELKKAFQFHDVKLSNDIRT